MDIVGLLRKERVVLVGKVNAVDVAIRLLGGGNAPRAKSPMSGKFGWGGRIRTFTVLINSEVSYQLDHAPVEDNKRVI